MSSIEEIFDINRVLQHSFKQVEFLSKVNNVTLIFEMEKTLPRELKGDIDAFRELLTRVFSFIFKHTQNDEILLSISAPDDFFYEEIVSFKIVKLGIDKKKILTFFETKLEGSLKKLSGEVVYEENDIHLNIPFIIGELGVKGDYVLPSKSMLDKKVLFISKSDYVVKGIGDMFKYFSYTIDTGIIAYKKNRLDLTQYDLVLIEEDLITKSFIALVQATQKTQNLNLVGLTQGNIHVNEMNTIVSDTLLMPATQESVLELIVSIFGNNTIPKENN